MTGAILHPRTLAKLTSIRSQLPHALLLAGDTGVGLATIAKELAGKELASIIEPINSKEVIDHATGTIPVAVIRSLYEKTRSKSTTNRVFVIDDADRMSPGASAAFLKLLEEPTPSTYFILTTHSPQNLLPTIRSRVQMVSVEPVSSAQTKELIATLGITDSKTTVQLEYLASGLPAELMRLTADKDYFTARAEVMSDTRTFLAGTTYQKILIANKYHQDRSRALQLLDSALIVTKRTLIDNPQSRLVTQLSALLAARERIEANGNIRLQLLSFVVQ